MRLHQLLVDGVVAAGGDLEVEITGLASDSRRVQPGQLFAALSGRQADGAGFARMAEARGAAAVLGDGRLRELGLAVPLLVADNPRRALARIAARFAGRQPATVVAVTGTNGKSSVASFTRQLWAAVGQAAGSIGTLGVTAPGIERPLTLTTPDPIELHAILAELADAGTECVAMEASSHALDQYRLDGVELTAAAFTNLTRDHFDYHGTPEAYFAAKARLFEELLPERTVAVLNADIPEFAELAAICAARRVAVVAYGEGGTLVRLLERRPGAAGQDLRVNIAGMEAGFTTPLVGDFQAANLLAAAGLALATGVAVDLLVEALPLVRGAKGRMELAGRTADAAAIYVDYAHTPDALARMLQALRPHTAGRLSCVFGAGGDRDPGKRPLMGEAVGRHADRAYVTDDNPRSEDPVAIRRAVLAGCPGGIDAGERRQAIARAIAELGRGDVLVVAGKGHEQGQTIGVETHPFDDAVAIREILAAQGRGAAA